MMFNNQNIGIRNFNYCGKIVMRMIDAINFCIVLYLPVIKPILHLFGLRESKPVKKMETERLSECNGLRFGFYNE